MAFRNAGAPSVFVLLLVMVGVFVAIFLFSAPKQFSPFNKLSSSNDLPNKTEEDKFENIDSIEVISSTTLEATKEAINEDKSSKKPKSTTIEYLTSEPTKRPISEENIQVVSEGKIINNLNQGKNLIGIEFFKRSIHIMF